MPAPQEKQTKKVQQEAHTQYLYTHTALNIARGQKSNSK